MSDPLGEFARAIETSSSTLTRPSPRDGMKSTMNGIMLRSGEVVRVPSLKCCRASIIWNHPANLEQALQGAGVVEQVVLDFV